MPPLLAAIPAITAISGLASAGAGVAGALAQGSNPGTQPLAPGVGQMNPNAFGYGGGSFQSPEAQAAQAALGPAQAAAKAAEIQYNKMHRLQLIANSGGKANGANLSVEERQLLANPEAFDKAMTAALQGKTDTRAALATAQKNASGAPGFAQSEANRLGGLAEAARNEKAPQLQLDAYNQTRDQAQQSRASELEALGLTRDAAMGNAPSAAQATLQRGVDAANQGASSLAASARGGGGNLALAGLQAGQQQATNAAAAGQEASILRANEMATARAAYQDASIRQRANELTAQGLDQQTAFKQAQLESETAQRRLTGGVAYEGLRGGVITEEGRGRQAFESGQAKANTDIATGNRTVQNQGFQDTQHAISTAVSATGQALAPFAAGAPVAAAPVKATAPNSAQTKAAVKGPGNKGGDG